MKYMGIDYSLVSPAVTILNDDCKFQNGNSYFLTNIKKYASCFGNVTGTLHKPYKHNIERYENIAMWALSLAKDADIVYCEDYSLGSIGKVFNIAECTGILKYVFYKNGFNIVPIPPSQIKKFATGKGNAKKEMMYDAFIRDGNFCEGVIFGMHPDGSPLSDIVDSFWIAKYAKESQV